MWKSNPWSIKEYRKYPKNNSLVIYCEKFKEKIKKAHILFIKTHHIRIT